MSYDPAKTGEAPIVWGAGAPPAGAPEPPVNDDLERRLGYQQADFNDATWLPDDPTALTAKLLEDGRTFNGAFVPLVIHDPQLAERSYDAAEWAADLIRTEGGQRLAIAPFADKGWAADAPLSPRQWNHAAAMVERLEELCQRFKLLVIVNDMIGDQQANEPDPFVEDLPIHYVLDAGSFVSDGFVSARLISPEKLEVAAGPLGERLRGLLRGRV
ncbi:MAG: hypothetical protein AAF531_02075 [Actinomycetota bacterium]